MWEFKSLVKKKKRHSGERITDHNMWSLYYGQEEWIGRAIGHSKLTIALSYGSHILWRPLSLIFLLIKLPTKKVDGPNTR